MSKLTVHGAKASSAATSKSDIVVVPLFTGEGLSSSASDVNAAAGDVLQRAISIGDADTKLGKITTMVGNDNISRVMAVGCGDRSNFNLEAQLTVTAAVSRALAGSKAKNAMFLGDSIAEDKDALAQFLEFFRPRYGDGLLPLHSNIGHPEARPHVY